MLENLLDLVFIAGMIAAYYFYIHAPKKKLKQKHMSDVPVLEENTHMRDLDFYGINKMDSDREKFMQEIRNKKTRMENGEEISVDAAQAFALIRNSKYNDLIVSEDGKINMKKIMSEEELEEIRNRIENFQKNKDEERVEFKVPGYVQRVEKLNNGGVRWVFTQEHAQWCGIESVCYDRFDRATPDPDRPIEDGKGKGKKQNQDSNSFLLESVNELKKEQRKTNQYIADNIMLDALKNNENLNADDAAILEKEIGIPDFENILEQESKIIEEKSSVIEPVIANQEESFEIESELEKIKNFKMKNKIVEPVSEDEEVCIPDFENILEQESKIIEEKNLAAEQIITNEENKISEKKEAPIEEIKNEEPKIQKVENNIIKPVILDQKKDSEIKNKNEDNNFKDIDYVSNELLRAYADKYPLFFQSVLQKLFSKDSANFLFLDFEKRNIYVEKNYFARTVKSFFDYNGRLKFDQDFN